MADIILVEDEEVLRRSLAKTLERDEHYVRAAVSAEDGLEMVRKGAPDLLITDHRLPGMSGYELLLTLKADHPGIAVIIITAHGTIEDAVGAMRDGAVDYLRKPIDLHEMLARVRSLPVRARHNDPRPRSVNSRRSAPRRASKSTFAKLASFRKNTRSERRK